MNCRHCSSGRTVRNGKKNGSQRWRCKDCGRNTHDPTGRPVGRPPIFGVAMTPTEHTKRSVAKRKRKSNEEHNERS